MKEEAINTTGRRRRAGLPRPRFTVATLFLAMIVFSVLGAGIYYASRAVASGFSFEGMVVVIVLCAPAVLFLVVVAAHAVFQWTNRDDIHDTRRQR